MADSTVGDLEQAATTLSDLDGAETINDEDLFLVEQNGQGKHLSGAQMRSFVDRHILSYDGEIVASDDDAGGVVYNPTTQNLTLKIPHGAGIAEVTLDHSEVVNGRVIDYYALKTQDVYVTDEIIEGEELPTKIKVTNGKDGQGTVNSVMGIGPRGEVPNPFIASQDVPKSALMDYIHPVGSVYISSRYFSPATQFSGTWVRLMNRFLYASGPGAANGAGNAVGTLDGSATKQLTAANIPSHTHELLLDSPVGSEYDHLGLYKSNNIWNTSSSSSAAGAIKIPDSNNVSTVTASKAYSDNPTPVDIMPPYRTYHAWERVSATHVYGSDAATNYFTPGAYVTTNTSTINMLSFNVAYDNMSTIVIAVSPGDKFSLTGTGASYGRLWAFVAADGSTRKRFALAGATATELELTANADEAFLIVNVNTEHSYSLVGLAPS